MVSLSAASPSLCLVLINFFSLQLSFLLQSLLAFTDIEETTSREDRQQQTVLKYPVIGREVIICGVHTPESMMANQSCTEFLRKQRPILLPHFLHLSIHHTEFLSSSFSLAFYLDCFTVLVSFSTQKATGKENSRATAASQPPFNLLIEYRDSTQFPIYLPISNYLSLNYISSTSLSIYLPIFFVSVYLSSICLSVYL